MPGCAACLQVRKFHDLDGDGQWDPGEEALPGMPFQIVEQGDALRYHRRESDETGYWEICFTQDTLVAVDELLREIGGRFQTTGEMPALMLLRCGQIRTYDVGNAPFDLPRTGAEWTYRAAGGARTGKPLDRLWAR